MNSSVLVHDWTPVTQCLLAAVTARQVNQPYILLLSVSSSTAQCPSLRFVIPSVHKQEAQLPHRDRATVSFGQITRKLELGDNILRTLYVYLKPLT